MRTITRGLWLLGGASIVWGGVVSCHAACGDTDSCGPYMSPGGGASGASGKGGTGTSGSAGTGNQGGGSAGESSGGTSGVGGSTNGGASGESGAAGDGGVPCDPTKTPSTEACLVGDDYAVFVAPDGKDNAAGTMSAPFASLSKAIAAAGSKFVVVCDATYDEHVVVSTGAQIYGGFGCPGAGGTWVAEVGAPLFKPSDAGPALKIDTVAPDVVIDGIKFEVPDATQPGGTALTALVNASPGVTFKNVSLTAGAGMNGADGTLQLFSYLSPTSLNGYPENLTGINNGAEKDCTCQTGLMSVGGVGGTPSSTGQSGAKGSPDHGGGQPGIPDNNDCGNGGTGKKGGDAPAMTASSGATTLGTISSTGWLPTGGVDGVIASPGQGGGGGASLSNLGHGGGGGCGGCGGNGGKGGRGGGASIALLALNSPVTLENCTLTSKDAGNGGAGHVGQPGQQTAGGGGSAINTLQSCGGGAGGKGGDGGASGGGAGGISVGVVWKGATAPTLTNTTTTTGKAGAKGIGGVPTANDGIAGVKQDVLQVQ